MKPKGSKFARKHNVVIEIEENDKLLSLPKEFVDFFENHFGFSKRFLRLSYDAQISLISHLYNFSSSEDPDYGEISSFYIQKIHEITDSDYEEGIYKPVAVAEKRLIRMDCYGSIMRRRPDELSELYRFFKHRKKEKHLLRDYNLDDSPAWKVMAQFESFRSIAPKIKRALYKSKMHPDVLKVMSVNDFCDLIYNTFQEGTEKAHFIKKENSIKNRYIKQFMKECGDSFYRMLIDRGIDERCVKSLCNKMRRFGSCDLESLIVTETHYTERVLKDLRKNGFDVRGIEVGMPIPDKFTDYLIDNKQENLILAREKDGSLVNKYVLPRLELHHSRAVQFADSEYLAASNYFNRLVLLESGIHHKYYHIFDSMIKQNGMQNQFSRLNISSPYMRMRIGFAPDDALYGDFENTAAFRQRIIEDKKHRVNYFEMRDLYLDNVREALSQYSKELGGFGKQYKAIINKTKPKKGTQNSIPPLLDKSNQER